MIDRSRTLRPVRRCGSGSDMSPLQPANRSAGASASRPHPGHSRLRVTSPACRTVSSVFTEASDQGGGRSVRLMRARCGRRICLGWKMASGPFTLVELARAVGMSVDDVRFYGECGLLQPPRRQDGGTDDLAFQTDHVERLRFIQRAIAHGLFLEDIERFVDETNLVNCKDVRRIAVHRLAEYRIARSSENPTVIALEKLIASCGGIGARTDCPILATLAKDEPAADQPNWDTTSPSPP